MALARRVEEGCRPSDQGMIHHRNFQRGGAMTGRVRPHPGETGGLAGPRAEKSVSLALQGGGAHGAFTWGVLDALLEDGRLAVEAITGASAGAMNAVVMVEGWLGGGIDGARSALETFWRRASLDGSLSPTQRRFSAGCSASGATRPGRTSSPKASVPTRRTRSTSIRCGTRSTRSSTSIACAPARMSRSSSARPMSGPARLRSSRDRSSRPIT